MMKFDYTHYQKLLDSFDLGDDLFDPCMEEFRKYRAISNAFDPINNPPGHGQKKSYILDQVVPILQEYAKDFQAQLIIEDTDTVVRIEFISKHLVILGEETDFISIFSFASSFFILPFGDYVKVQFYFNLQ